MATCTFCGQKAGLFRREHKPCRSRYDAGGRALVDLAAAAACGERDLAELTAEARRIGHDARIDDDQIRQALLQGWERSAQSALEDHVVTADEETSLARFQHHCELTAAECDRNGWATRIAQGRVLSALMAGEPPEPFETDSPMPFNLQKSEELVWAFSATAYEERIRRKVVGRSSGVSVRLMKGVYYRVGGFEGHPVQTTQLARLDSGLVGLTTKHVYFAGPRKAFRVRYDKVAAFTPYADGFGVQKEAVSARPLVFVTGDGWFPFNLATTLARR